MFLWYFGLFPILNGWFFLHLFVVGFLPFFFHFDFYLLPFFLLFSLFLQVLLHLGDSAFYRLKFFMQSFVICTFCPQFNFVLLDLIEGSFRLVSVDFLREIFLICGTIHRLFFHYLCVLTKGIRLTVQLFFFDFSLRCFDAISVYVFHFIYQRYRPLISLIINYKSTVLNPTLNHQPSPFLILKSTLIINFAIFLSKTLLNLFYSIKSL